MHELKKKNIPQHYQGKHLGAVSGCKKEGQSGFLGAGGGGEGGSEGNNARPVAAAATF